jgi:hypothetical protein
MVADYKFYFMSLNIDFYTHKKYKNLVPPPIPSAKCIPKWFSELELRKEKNNFPFRIDEKNPSSLIISSSFSAKSCPSMQDVLKTGYVIPSWADFIFRESDNGDLQVNWMNCYFEEIFYEKHYDDQYNTMTNKPIYGHYGKVQSPWAVKTDPGVSCLILDPYWHRHKSFTSVFGIYHTDVSPMVIRWFFEWNYKIKSKMSLENLDEEKQLIKKGDPLMLIVPFYRKKYSSRINYLDEDDWSNITMTELAGIQRGLSECPYKKFRRTLGKLFN